MIILGISEEGESGVSIVENGKLIYSINEERLTRIKLQRGFPEKSLERAVKYLEKNKKIDDLSGIAIASRTTASQVSPEVYLENESSAVNEFVTNIIRSLLKTSKISRSILANRSFIKIGIKTMRALQYRRYLKWRSFIERTFRKNVKWKFYDHHESHAASAYYTSGFEESLVFTFDGIGDGYCSKTYIGHNGKLSQIEELPFTDSVAYYYTAVTYALGFKRGQEGKVTGLSARGNPKKCREILEERLKYNENKMRFINNGYYYTDEINYLKEKFKEFSREDVSAGVQEFLEKGILSYLRDIIKKHKITKIDISLAGGIFANVLLNRKIADIEEINKAFIHPNMSDGGLATGAALLLFKELNKGLRPYRIEHVYLGDSYSDEEIEKEIVKNGLDFFIPKNMESEIAKLISENNIVAHFYGRMEYGPRALGNRSILYNASDNKANDWLNRQLKRSEFMPFAPAITEEDYSEYVEIKSQLHPSMFMTIVSDTTNKCKIECPAIVHIDGTARPQIVTKSSSPRFHGILSNYKKITGIPVLVNTSFNMHEEPIVESPSTAIRAFLDAKLDCLAIGKFIIKKKNIN
ncbi:MAG: carbamoyltransferase C-terminal domain-containing protein [Thermodesulfobacteriota bacterium]|nr:carbamoyltransferase C-terminal domain-containing protein [Thermodesulfobacteriota bacterium]